MTTKSSQLQLRRHRRLLLNLLNHTSRPIGTRLRKATQIRRVKSQADNRIASAVLGFGNASTQGVIPAAIQHRREPAQLAASHGLYDHAQPSGNVARANGQAVDGAKHFDDAVTGEIHHCCGDDAFGFGELRGQQGSLLAVTHMCDGGLRSADQRSGEVRLQPLVAPFPWCCLTPNPSWRWWKMAGCNGTSSWRCRVLAPRVSEEVRTWLSSLLTDTRKLSCNSTGSPRSFIDRLASHRFT